MSKENPNIPIQAVREVNQLEITSFFKKMIPKQKEVKATIPMFKLSRRRKQKRIVIVGILNTQNPQVLCCVF